jgi:ribonuclease HI
MIKIYTDGSCIRNPNGPGGWALCIIEDDNPDFYFSGCDTLTTNNRMELKAIIEAVSCLKKNQECIIYSDSQLTINCASGKWKRKANLDLWKEYDLLSKYKKIHFEWVKAHNGDKYNELVDTLAYKEAMSI